MRPFGYQSAHSTAYISKFGRVARTILRRILETGDE